MTGIFDRDGVNRGGGGDVFPTRNYTEDTGTGTGTITLTPGNDITINGGTTAVEGTNFVIASTAVSPDTTYDLTWNGVTSSLQLTDSDGTSDSVPVRAGGDLTLSTSNGGILISYTNPNPNPYADVNPDVPNFNVASAATDPDGTEYALVNDGSGNVAWEIIVDSEGNPGITQAQADARYVSFAIDQRPTIDESEAAVARANIRAGTSDFSGSFNDLDSRPSVLDGDGNTASMVGTDVVPNTAALTNVTNAVNTERTERMSADTTITTNYQAADANLQSQIDAITVEDAAITVDNAGNAVLDSATTAASVRNVIDAVSDTELSAETTARIAADTAEQNARTALQTSLQNQITTGDQSVRTDLTNTINTDISNLNATLRTELDNRIQNSETTPTENLIDGTLWVDHQQGTPQVHVWNGLNFELISGGSGVEIPSGTSLPTSPAAGDYFFLTVDIPATPESSSFTQGLYLRDSTNSFWIAGNDEDLFRGLYINTEGYSRGEIVEFPAGNEQFYIARRTIPPFPAGRAASDNPDQNTNEWSQISGAGENTGVMIVAADGVRGDGTGSGPTNNQLAFDTPTTSAVPLPVSGQRNVDVSIISNSLTFNSIIPEWDSTVDYTSGDEVKVRVGQTRDYTIYIANAESTNINPATDNGTHWERVNTPAAADADDFEPGHRYSFVGVVDGQLDTGVIGTAYTVGINIDRVSNIGSIVLRTSILYPNDIDRNAVFGFVVSGADVGRLMPGETEPRVIYVSPSPIADEQADWFVVQVDPPVNSLSNLQSLFGQPNTGSRDITAVGATLLTLIPDTQADTATWAQVGNTDAIPDGSGNKLNNVEEWARTRFPNQQIPNSKLHTVVTTSSVTDGTNTFDKYTDAEARMSVSATDGTADTSRPGGGLDYDNTSGEFTFRPATFPEIEAGLTGQTLTRMDEISFAQDQFNQTTVTNAGTGETEHQFALRADVTPGNPFRLDIANSSWFGRARRLSRPIYETESTVSVYAQTRDIINFPLNTATLNSVVVFNTDNPSGLTLRTDQYTFPAAEEGSPNITVNTESVSTFIRSDFFRTATRVEVSLTVGTSAENIDDIMITIPYTTYTPVLSGVTDDDDSTVNPGVDPRWMIAFTGTSNPVAPPSGENSTFAIGLLNNSGGAFNSGTDVDELNTTSQATLEGNNTPRAFGFVGDPTVFRVDLSVISDGIFNSFATAPHTEVSITVHTGTASAYDNGSLRKFPVNQNIFQIARAASLAAQDGTVGQGSLASSLATFYRRESPLLYQAAESNSSADFNISFTEVDGQSQMVDVRIEVDNQDGRPGDNVVYSIGPEVLYFTHTAIASGHTVEQIIPFESTNGISVILKENRVATWTLDIDVDNTVYSQEFMNIPFTADIGPDAALQEIFTRVQNAIGPSITQVGTGDTFVDRLMDVTYEGNDYRVLDMDLGTATALTNLFSVNPQNSSVNANMVYSATPNASTLNALLMFENSAMPGTIFPIPLSLTLGSGLTSTEIADLMRSIMVLITFGGVLFFNATGPNVDVMYSTPNAVPTTANTFTVSIDNGTGTGDAAATVTNNVVGEAGQLGELTASIAGFDRDQFYDGETGVNHHLLVANSAIGSSTLGFTVREDDSGILYPWETNGSRYYEQYSLNIFGIPYTGFRFSTRTPIRDLTTDISIRGSTTV